MKVAGRGCPARDPRHQRPSEVCAERRCVPLFPLKMEKKRKAQLPIGRCLFRGLSTRPAGWPGTAGTPGWGLGLRPGIWGLLEAHSGRRFPRHAWGCPLGPHSSTWCPRPGEDGEQRGEDGLRSPRPLTRCRCPVLARGGGPAVTGREHEGGSLLVFPSCPRQCGQRLPAWLESGAASSRVVCSRERFLACSLRAPPSSWGLLALGASRSPGSRGPTGWTGPAEGPLGGGAGPRHRGSGGRLLGAAMLSCGAGRHPEPRPTAVVAFYLHTF